MIPIIPFQKEDVQIILHPQKQMSRNLLYCSEVFGLHIFVKIEVLLLSFSFSLIYTFY